MGARSKILGAIIVALLCFDYALADNSGYQVKADVTFEDVVAFGAWLSGASTALNADKRLDDVLTLSLASQRALTDEYEQPLISVTAKMEFTAGDVVWSFPKKSLALIIPEGTRNPLPKSFPELSLALEQDIISAESVLSMRLLPDQRCILALLLALHSGSDMSEESSTVRSSHIREWFGVLPPSFNTPFYWSKDEIAQLKGTQLYANTKQAKTLIKEDNADILRPLREDSPEKYPKDLFNSASLKWAKAVWRSRVTSCIINDDSDAPQEFDCFHPLYELVNYRRTPSVNIIDKGDALELVALKDIAAGEEVVIADSSQLSDMQLLDYYGYLREDDQQFTYDFGVGLDSSESMYGWKKDLLSYKNLRDHQLYPLMAKQPPTPELLYALRVYFMTVYESDELEPLFSMEPLSLNNELEVFSAIGSTCLRKMQKFTVSLNEQREELSNVMEGIASLEHTDLSSAPTITRLVSLKRQMRALKYAIAEREILLYHERYASRVVEEVRASWDTRSFDLPTNQQVIL